MRGGKRKRGAGAPLFERLESRQLMSAELVPIGEQYPRVFAHEDHGEFQATMSHYFPEPVDGHRFAWADQDPSTPETVDLLYDFRAQKGYANKITPGQRSLAELAMQFWSSASGGRLTFTRSTSAPRSDVINIGTGNLRALGIKYSSVRDGLLGLGGGDYTEDGSYEIYNGVAWLDFAERWDEVFNSGNPSGTYDYFTIVAHEIGHALGLGHTDDLPGESIMDGRYTLERTGLSQEDAAHVNLLYEPGPPPPRQVGVVVTPMSRRKTSERGRSAVVEVSMTGPPIADVTIPVASSNESEGVADVAGLTFTAANWSTPQRVTVMGVNDFRRDGKQRYTLLLGPAVSEDADYNGLDPEDVNLVNRGNGRRR